MDRKMSKKKRQLLTIVLLCVLLIASVIGFFAVTKYKNDSEEKENSSKNIELYSVKDDDISSFHFKNSKEELTFVKEKNKWVLKDDSAYDIDQSKVTTLIDDVKKISATSIVTSDCTDLSQYGLENPTLQVEITDKNGNKKTLTVGDESVAGEGCYAYVGEDSKKVYIIASTFISDFETTKKELKAEATAAPTATQETTKAED